MATKANITIDQGTTFETPVILTDENDDPIDMSHYTYSAQIKEWYTSSTVKASFVVDYSNSVPGVLTLKLSANTTANLASGRYVYDVKVTDGDGVKTRILEGTVTITPGVSA